MGLNPTGPYYKGFTFDGDSSKDYGVFLTGEGVFNAPERSVEEIPIPGRNGNYILDLGRFENILVTYKAGLVDYNEADFADRIGAVRNWLCSKVGYQRLEDEYNPGEYRLAAYKNGVELEHFDLKTGEFSITFNCKPQRWLTSGETAVAVANNGTLTNPELFDSSPLLAVKGYGDIAFNGYNINLQNVDIGDVFLKEGTTNYYLEPITNINFSILNVGDTITLKNMRDTTQFEKSSTPYYTPSSISVSCSNSSFHSVATATTTGAIVATNVDDLTFSVGTTSSYYNTITLVLVMNGTTYTWTQETQIQYNAISGLINFMRNGYTWSPSSSGQARQVNNGCYGGVLYGYSTKSALGNPTYIDCDIGECYMIENNEIVSLNQQGEFGSDLPVLASGTNTFTYDNTITELKVTPRWWKV